MAKQLHYGKTPEDFKRMVDIANRRLRRIENEYAKKKGFENIKGFAYHKAMRDIKAAGGNKRFSKKIPKTKREFNKMWNAVDRFLQSPTSTLGGVRNVYEKRAKTLADKYGLDVGWENLGIVFESGLFARLNTGYGSKSALRKIGVMIENQEKIESVIDQSTHFKNVTDITPFENDMDNMEIQKDILNNRNDLISLYESLI